MSYTDQDVEEVINAYFVSYNTSKNARGQTADASTVHRKAHEQGVRAARAALEAMAREPIKDARAALEAMAREPIKDAGILSLHVDRLGRTFYARGLRHRDNMTVEYSVTGATIDEAIRAAVAAAKGGE